MWSWGVSPVSTLTDFFSAEASQETSGYCGLGLESDFCGSKVIPLVCENRLHAYAKRVFCGRDWCDRCGKKESVMHKRRYMRAMDKVFFLGLSGGDSGIGYYVFTIPPNIRDKFEEQENLYRAGNLIQKLLRRYGFLMGCRRWHFFSEKSLDAYHPHLNCLVVGKKLSISEINGIRGGWRVILESITGESLDAVDAWYRYYPEKSQWWHKAKYITRSTILRRQGWEVLINSLWRFHNTVYWGWGRNEERIEKEHQGRLALDRWLEGVKSKEGEIEEVVDEILGLAYLTRMCCPECLELFFEEAKLRVAKIKSKKYLKFDNGRVGHIKGESVAIMDYDESFKAKILKDYGGGFFQIPMDPRFILKTKPKSSAKKNGFGGSGNHDPPRIDQFKLDFVRNGKGLVH